MATLVGQTQLRVFLLMEFPETSRPYMHCFQKHHPLVLKEILRRVSSGACRASAFSLGEKKSSGEKAGWIPAPLILHLGFSLRAPGFQPGSQVGPETGYLVPKSFFFQTYVRLVSVRTLDCQRPTKTERVLEAREVT